jgi:hypothetical protein
MIFKTRSKRQNKPEAEVIRELVNEGLQSSRNTGQESTGASLLRLAGIHGKAPADLSTRIDEYLYGEDN